MGARHREFDFRITDFGFWGTASGETFKIRNPQSEIRNFLRGFRLPTDLFLNFPVGEQILMAAPWALPGSLHGIGAPLMEHLHDQVAMQTHGWMAVDHIVLCGLCHDWHEYLLIG